MHYVTMIIALATDIASVLILFWLATDLVNISKDIRGMTSLAISIFTPTPILNLTIATKTLNGNNTGLDPTIIAALIGIVVAIIAGGFLVFQTIYNAKIQRETAEAQRRHEEEMHKLRSQHEQEMQRIQRELEAKAKAEEQAEQHKAAAAEAAYREMLIAQNNAERANAYRRALHADPRISHVQILEMSRPLEVTNIYVRVRIHEQTRLRYDVDPLFRAAEKKRDPKVLLQAGRRYQELLINTAIDPAEAIRKYQRCIIVGDPGAGKTTLLKFLTLKAADNDLKNFPDLPIHIELNAFASSEYLDMIEFAASVWDERYAFFKADARAYMDEMLKAGKALVLLDALDETVIGEQAVIAEASYKRASDAIIQLTTRYPKSPIVVTARKAGYHQRMPLAGFTELEVVDFSPEDIQQFIRNWFACYHDPQKEANALDLNNRLERNPRIQALAANPLLLSLIVLVYEAELDLPDRRADLYKRCIDVLLAEWDAKRNIRRRREFKPDHKRQLLAEVAWHFHLQGLRYFPEREVLEEIAHFLPALGLPPEQHVQVLQEIANENGLLKEQAQGWYGFLHLTLQEYFAAQYVNDRNELLTLLTHVGDPWWEEVLLLYAGQTPDASSLIQRLLDPASSKAIQDDLFYTNLIMAGRCLAAHPTIRQASLREEVVPRLFKLLRSTPYSLTRKQVAEALVEIGGTKVLSSLIQLLKDKRIGRSVRKSVAEALGALGERSVIPDLLQLMGNEQIDPSVRQSIAIALGTLGEKSVAPDLLHLLPLLNQKLHSHPVDNWWRRKQLFRSVAEALGTLGEKSVAPMMLQLLDTGTFDYEEYRSIVIALGMLDEKSIVPVLLRQLKRTDHRRISTLEEIAPTLGALGEKSVVPELLQLLGDRKVDSRVRRSIPKALAALGERSVVPMFLRQLNNRHISRSVRQSVAEALGALGERSVIPDLLQLVGNEQIDPSVRQSITIALGTLGEKSVARILLRKLRNNRRDQIRISEILGALGEKSVVPDLIRLLGSKHLPPRLHQGIVKAIGQIADDEQTIHELVALLQRPYNVDAIYDALWAVSQRAGIRVIVKDQGAAGRGVELQKRQMI